MPLVVSPVRRSNALAAVPTNPSVLLDKATSKGMQCGCIRMGESPVDSKVHPVVVLAAAAFAVGVDVHGDGAACAEALAVAELLVVLFNEDRVVQKAAALSVLSVICSSSVNASQAQLSAQSYALTSSLRPTVLEAPPNGVLVMRT